MQRLIRTFLAVAATLALGATSALAAQPNPGPDWMLEGKPSIKQNFVPDPYAGVPVGAGHQAGRVNTMSADGNKNSGQARNVSAPQAVSLTGATAVKAAGGGARAVDLTQLLHRLSSGPVDFGDDGRAYFQLSRGTGGSVAFRAYKGTSLVGGSAGTVEIGANSPLGVNGDLLVSLTAVSKDGSTLQGVFKAPNGQVATLVAR